MCLSCIRLINIILVEIFLVAIDREPNSAFLIVQVWPQRESEVILAPLAK